MFAPRARARRPLGHLPATHNTHTHTHTHTYTHTHTNTHLPPHTQTQTHAKHTNTQTQVSKAQADTGDNHSISALKFGILRKFITAGWAVLLSDIDIAVLQNPFGFLKRDSDVEGQSDGFDAPGAYGAIDGVDDPSMGWARCVRCVAVCVRRGGRRRAAGRRAKLAVAISSS